MELINLTPHEINIFIDDESDDYITLEATSLPARAEMKEKVVETINFNGKKIPIIKNEFGKVENLPEPKKGVKYVVSRIVAETCFKRDDLLVPFKIMRGGNGLVIGCKSLSVI